MLNNFLLKDEKKAIVPAIIHLDQTARVQTIDKNTNSKLYTCIYNYFPITGVPIICNTSLNDKWEPIIDTIEEALNFALRKKIKVMYINGWRVVLKNHSLFKVETPKNRKHDVFSRYADVLESKLTKSEYSLYFSTPQLQHHFNIENDDEVKKLKLIIKKLQKK